MTCRKIGFFDAGFSEGLYDNIDLAAAGQPPDLLWFNATRAWSTAPTAQVAVGRDRIDLELWYQGTFASAPATESYDATSKYLKCDVCVIYWEGYIPSTDQYDRAYFPQAGSATVSQATQSADGGTMAGTGSNLKLVEWDLDADEPVAGGQCIEMPAATFSSSW